MRYPHPYDLNQAIRTSFDSNALTSFEPAAKPPLRARVQNRLGLVPLPGESPGYHRVRYSDSVSAVVHMLASVGNAGVVQMIK